MAPQRSGRFVRGQVEPSVYFCRRNPVLLGLESVLSKNSFTVTVLVFFLVGCGGGKDSGGSFGSSGQGGSAAVSTSPTSVDFGDQSVGSNVVRTVTVTNAGTISVTLTTADTSSPFAVGGASMPQTLGPGESVQLTVTFVPSVEGSFDGSLTLDFDSLDVTVVSLSGTVPAGPTGPLGITTSSLPTATLGASYLASIQTSGGTAPFEWEIVGANVQRLTLDVTTGTLSDIPGSLGPFDLMVRVTDSSSPEETDTVVLPLLVASDTGADCDGIFVGLTPLNDLGAGLYQGHEGGLYPGGGNVRPSAHDQAGFDLGSSIQPLDAAGNPDPSGSYVLISIGMSNATQEFSRFVTVANADPDKHPRLVVLDGAQGGQTAEIVSNPSAAFWSNVDTRLGAAGVTPNQVVAAWVKEVNAFDQAFPEDFEALRDDLEAIANILKTRFPNIQVAYYSSRTYGGYATTDLNPESIAYESGFAVKWLVEDQIDGSASLNYDAGQGAVVAPWIAWGPYLWADGLVARSDGLVWTCQDFERDGTHPSPEGQDKVAEILLDFFKSDSTTREWFLASP